MDIQKTISDKILQLMKERGLVAKPFGDKLGIHNLGRMLANERNWTLKNLERIAGALGVTVGTLLQDYANIPIILELKSPGAFQFPLVIKPETATGWVPTPIPAEVGGAGLIAKLYAIAVHNNRFFDKPLTLIAIKDPDEIQDRDYVVYCDPQGIGHIGQVKLFDKKVFFKNLDPADSFQDQLLDSGQLRMMDRIAYLKV